MTLRRTTAAPTSVEEIAARVPGWLTDHITEPSFTDPNVYRDWFDALTDEVAVLTGVHDPGLAMSVAQALGVAPAHWFQRVLPVAG